MRHISRLSTGSGPVLDDFGPEENSFAVLSARERRRGNLRRVQREERAAADVDPNIGEPIPDVTIRALLEEVAQILPMQREAIVLHYLEGKTYEEAACALGTGWTLFSQAGKAGGNREHELRPAVRESLVYSKVDPE